MTSFPQNFKSAVGAIKEAILRSQHRALSAVNREQLSLYYGIGRYVSQNSRKGFWGTGAIEQISETLQKELPGLRGFSATNIRNMRLFYEEWCETINRSFSVGEIEDTEYEDVSNRSTVSTDLQNVENQLIINSAAVAAELQSSERQLITNSAATAAELEVNENLLNINSAVATAELQSAENQLITNSADASAELEVNENLLLQQIRQIPSAEFQWSDFMQVGFSHHREIIRHCKSLKERLYYIRESATQFWSYYTLKDYLKADLYHKRGTMPNNFALTMPDVQQALKAIGVFKDEYLIDYINTEQYGEREEDFDERVLQREIVANIRKFIMTFGRDFSFVGSQYRVEIAGEELFIDLLFFNRELNALVAIELKNGKFRASYLGQLNLYLQALDEKVRKPHENQSVGIILCKEMNETFVQFAVRDYTKPMGVAVYRTAEDMPEKLRDALPSIEELKKLL